MYLLCLALVSVAVSAPAAFGQSRMPADAENWLQVVGRDNLGSESRANVTFFEIPDTETGALYFAVRDPGLSENGEAPNDGDALNDVDTDFYLIGFSGALSHPSSRQRIYTVGASDALEGTELGYIQGGDSADGEGTGWVYFDGVDPSQGERIGNRYYFRVVAIAEDASSCVQHGSVRLPARGKCSRFALPASAGIAYSGGIIPAGRMIGRCARGAVSMLGTLRQCGMQFVRRLGRVRGW